MSKQTNPRFNLFNQHIHDHYCSPHSFSILKKQLSSPNKSNFSVLHNNVRSVRSNLENLQTHFLDELKYGFNVIGISETQLTEEKEVDFNPSIPGYSFENVPTPLAAGDVGIHVKDFLNYTEIEKTSKETFQALSIEIQFSGRPNVICRVIYRQHNSPKCFQDYFEETLERLFASNKSVFIMGDFNINLLGVEKCNYVHNFQLSLQSFSFTPTFDKQTCVHSWS